MRLTTFLAGAAIVASAVAVGQAQQTGVPPGAQPSAGSARTRRQRRPGNSDSRIPFLLITCRDRRPPILAPT